NRHANTQDAELRAQVRMAGTLLGEVLRSQASPGVFEAVEQLRQGYIALRDTEDSEKRDALQKLVVELPAATMTEVVRAFAIYFNLANLLEELHGYRTRLVWGQTDGPMWPGSFDQTIHKLHEQGHTLEGVQTYL